MNQQHKDILTEQRKAIYKDITMSGSDDLKKILQYLFSKNIILKSHKERIDQLVTSETKISELVDILPRRGPNAFRVFLDALKEVGILDLYEMLGSMSDKVEFVDREGGAQLPTAEASNWETPTISDLDKFGIYVVMMADNHEVEDLKKLTTLFEDKGYSVYKQLKEPHSDLIPIVLLLQHEPVDLDTLAMYQSSNALIFRVPRYEDQERTIQGCDTFNCESHTQMQRALTEFLSKQTSDFSIEDLRKGLGIRVSINCDKLFMFRWGRS